MVPERRTLLTVGLVAALMLSGCLGTGPLSDEEEQRVADEFEERFEEIDGFTATIHSEMDGSNVSYESTAKVWQRPNTGEMRQETVAPDERAGDVTVTNGSASINYDESENTYTTFDLSDVTGSSNDLGTQLRNLLDRFEVHYNGTATVDDESTHKVTLVPENTSESASDYRMTMWLDDENYFPVKQEMTSDEFDVATTTRYENVSINPGIADEKFEFEPPEGATEEETGIDTYDSREALAEGTNVTLPEPNLPEGYSFDSGSVSTFNGSTSVTLQYADGETPLSLSVRDATREPSEGDETVDLGNATGQYSSVDSYGFLHWSCGDETYSVAGEVEKETLTDVGASIECPA